MGDLMIISFCIRALLAVALLWNRVGLSQLNAISCLI